MKDTAEQIYVGECVCVCELMYIRGICSYNSKCYEIGEKQKCSSNLECDKL